MTLLHQAAQKAVEAQRALDYEAGWRAAASWASRFDLLADIGSPAYDRDRAEFLKAALQQQPEPVAYKDSTPELHVGNSSFESWYSRSLFDGRYLTGHNKQDMRDAYAAGMGDPLVMAVPALQHQEEPREPVARPSMSMYASAADYSAAMDGWIAATRQCPACKGKFGVDGQACDLCNATGRVPSTTRQQEVGSGALDARRYRWLRAQHWNEAPMCVVMQPKQAVKLGHDCPALERLDTAIDAAMAAAHSTTAHQISSPEIPDTRNGVPASDDARDAARYRWLKAKNSGPIGIVRYGMEHDEHIPTDRIDSAIDEAIGNAGAAAPSTPEKAGGVSDGVGQFQRVTGTLPNGEATYRFADGVPAVPASGPLRDLGAYLARVLDEDQWAHAEALLLKATDGVKAAERMPGVPLSVIAAVITPQPPTIIDGVAPTVPVNRPATLEEAQHAAQIGACLPNGVLFDAFGRQRVRYVRITLDGAHLILHPNELAAWKASEENPDQFTYADVYLSEEEADALPEFDGF